MSVLDRFNPDSSRALAAFTERAVSRPFAQKMARAMHSRLVLGLDPDTFRSLYEEVAEARTLDDLSADARALLRQAVAEVEGKTWTSEQEHLHPRGEHGRFRSKPGEQLAQAVEDIDQVVNSVMDTAHKNERTISATLQQVSRETKGKLEGFKYRLKSRDSILSKIRRDREKMPGASDAEIARAINDTVRYTQVFNADDYSSGVQAAMAALSSRGYEVHKLKNYWEPGDAYNGINAVFRHKETGFTFELQFHTPESWDTKDKVHLLYEHFRESADEHERMVLYHQMVKASDNLPRPPGVMELGGLTQTDYAPAGYNPIRAEAAMRASAPSASAAVLEPQIGGRGNVQAPGTRISTPRESPPGTMIPNTEGPVTKTSDVNEAVRLIAEGKHVELDQPEMVSTLLDKLAAAVKAAKDKGDKAPNFDLCKVSVKGTNVFCAQHKDIPRLWMPQLSGEPLPGSRAADITPDQWGTVNLGPQFLEHLRSKGINVETTNVQASHLHASQREMNGGKVGKLMQLMQTPAWDDSATPPLFVSRNNYVIDGHHRWAAKVGIDFQDNKPDMEMPVTRIDMDILDVLAEAVDFAKEWGMPQAGVGE